MDIRDLLEQELTQEQIEQQMLTQGRLVLEVVAHPGWQVVLSHLAAGKRNVERTRMGGLSADPNGSRALYYSGKVDGFNEAIETISRVISEANEVEKVRNLNKGEISE